jgi:hypothetical protein
LVSLAWLIGICLMFFGWLIGNPLLLCHGFSCPRFSLCEASRLRRLLKRSKTAKSKRLTKLKEAARVAGWDVSPGSIGKHGKDPSQVGEPDFFLVGLDEQDFCLVGLSEFGFQLLITNLGDRSVPIMKETF